MCRFDVIKISSFLRNIAALTPKIKFYILASFLIISTSSLAQETVRLTTKVWSPYHYFDESGELQGRSVDVLQCAFAKLAMPFNIEVLPWARAQILVKKGQADGFFSASWNAKRDQYAKRSADIAPQNWTWYYLPNSKLPPDSPEFKSKAKVGATLGSNIRTWLVDNNYSAATKVNTSEQLLKVLLAKRVDAFMANELVMGEIIQKAGVEGKVLSQVARSMPVGVYFSDKFLKDKPEFLDQFNQAVTGCRPSL